MDIAFGRRSVVAGIAAGGQLASPEGVAHGPAPVFSPADDKYKTLGRLGLGGMGEVLLVRGRDLLRDVAMKLVRDDIDASQDMRRKFVAEAQATSQLEHPGIPPVYDIGLSPDGRCYYAMKLVRGRSLAKIVELLAKGDDKTTEEYTIHKLITELERVAEAVHFAHEKGVIHRDLKPENVMLGKYGEVLVVDWGLAKVMGEAEATAAPVQTNETLADRATQMGTVKGTIPYMSPEQAFGHVLDRRSDVYALGAILYELLTLRPAFEGAAVFPLLLRVARGEFEDVATKNPDRPVHEFLADLCRRTMAKDPAERPATAQAFAVELRGFLDGRAEKDRRHREAEALAAQGRDAMARYVAAKGAVSGVEAEAVRIAALFKPWQSAEEKRPARTAIKAVEDARQAVVLALAETTRLLEGALLAEPENATARGLLGDLWKGRLDDAERRLDRADAAHALTMLRRYDDGRLAELISGEGALELTSDPPGARVALVCFEDDLGTTPLAPVPLPMGTYLAILRMPGFPDVRYPVHITRNRRWTGRVTMRTREEIGHGFVYVPGGPFTYGEGKATRTFDLPDFAIAAKPITFGDWAQYLAAVEREEGLDAARKLVPSVKGDGDYMERRDDGVWVPLPNNVEGPARERCLRDHGPEFEMQLPLAGVSWHDAVAYCEWKTRTTGRQWRLPSEEEREKAARGVDGREFPWGGADDASLCKCSESRNEPQQPEPVGAFPAATSVYGMIDAAGSSWDWTSAIWDPLRPAASDRVLRGGSWISVAANARSAARNRFSPGARFGDLGFRPARSFDS